VVTVDVLRKPVLINPVGDITVCDCVIRDETYRDDVMIEPVEKVFESVSAFVLILLISRFPELF